MKTKLVIAVIRRKNSELVGFLADGLSTSTLNINLAKEFNYSTVTHEATKRNEIDKDFCYQPWEVSL